MNTNSPTPDHELSRTAPADTLYLGLDDEGRDVAVRHHLAIVGWPGTGKTVAATNLVVSALLRGSRETAVSVISLRAPSAYPPYGPWLADTADTVEAATAVVQDIERRALLDDERPRPHTLLVVEDLDLLTDDPAAADLLTGLCHLLTLGRGSGVTVVVVAQQLTDHHLRTVPGLRGIDVLLMGPTTHVVRQCLLRDPENTPLVEEITGVGIFQPQHRPAVQVHIAHEPDPSIAADQIRSVRG